MEGRVYSEILRRTEERRGANVIPEGTLLRSLSELRKRGRILVGRTLNDWWIKPVEGTEPK